jgi:hypothetical protein
MIASFGFLRARAQFLSQYHTVSDETTGHLLSEAVFFWFSPFVERMFSTKATVWCGERPLRVADQRPETFLCDENGLFGRPLKLFRLLWPRLFSWVCLTFSRFSRSGCGKVNRREFVSNTGKQKDQMNFVSGNSETNTRNSPHLLVDQ